MFSFPIKKMYKCSGGFIKAIVSSPKSFYNINNSVSSFNVTIVLKLLFNLNFNNYVLKYINTIKRHILTILMSNFNTLNYFLFCHQLKTKYWLTQFRNQVYWFILPKAILSLQLFPKNVGYASLISIHFLLLSNYSTFLNDSKAKICR